MSSRLSWLSLRISARALAPEPIARAADLACDTTITGHHTGPLEVSDGTTCLDEATVNGAVTIETDASLVALDSRLHDQFFAEGAIALVMCGTSIKGPVCLTGGTNVELGDPTAPPTW